MLRLAEYGCAGREEKIIEAAVRIFAQKGFTATTTKEIARTAGVAEGTIFNYYKTKKDILKKITSLVIRMLSGGLLLKNGEAIFLSADSSKGPREILREFIRDRMQLAQDLSPMVKTVFIEAFHHPEIKKTLIQHVIRPAMDIFQEFYQLMLARGYFKPDLSPQVILRSIMGNIALLIAQRELLGGALETADREMEINRTIEIILYGVAYKPH